MISVAMLVTNPAYQQSIPLVAFSMMPNREREAIEVMTALGFQAFLSTGALNRPAMTYPATMTASRTSTRAERAFPLSMPSRSGEARSSNRHQQVEGAVEYQDHSGDPLYRGQAGFHRSTPLPRTSCTISGRRSDSLTFFSQHTQASSCRPGTNPRYSRSEVISVELWRYFTSFPCYSERRRSCTST